LPKTPSRPPTRRIILRKVSELALNPGMNVQDGMLTTHSERAWLAEAELLREFLGAPDDLIDCPTDTQRELFGAAAPPRAAMMDLKNPVLLGPVQNQEHHMNGVAARRNNWNEPILGFLEAAYREFGELTGRRYGSSIATAPTTPRRSSSRSAAPRRTSRPPATTCANSATRRSAPSTST
jgi:pyruvate/2-oxoacid:ferredoxin oxidoreductase alpha subunit